MNVAAFFTVMFGFLLIAVWAAAIFKVGDFFTDRWGDLAGGIAVGLWVGLPFAVVFAFAVGPQ